MNARHHTAQLLLSSLAALIASSAQAETTTLKTAPAPAMEAASKALPAGKAAKIKAPLATSTAPASLDKSGMRELRVRTPPPPPPPIIPNDQLKQLDKAKGMQ
jgi:hypothetical protein